MMPADVFDNVPDESWRLLGEFRMPADSSANSAVDSWIKETLKPLELSSDRLRSIVISAEEAVTHRMKPGSSGTDDAEHIHMQVFVPGKVTPSPVREQAWGFFSICRSDPDLAEEGPACHTVEFYLYVED